MIFLALVLGPVTLVGVVGGIKTQPKEGLLLGAHIANKDKKVVETASGDIKKFKITTRWGTSTTYQKILRVKNNTTTVQKYNLEILKISGIAPRKQAITAYFQNSGATATLKPGEETSITLKVRADTPQNLRATQTQTQVKLAVWKSKNL